MSVNEVKISQAPFAFQVRGTGPPRSRTFAIGNEDHTIGNSLRHVLMQNAKVEFAGYSVPHPSEPVVHLRIQTNKGNDEAEYTAVDALKEACTTLHDQCAHVLEKLEDAMPEVKEDRIKMEDLRLREEQEAGEYEEDDDEEIDYMQHEE